MKNLCVWKYVQRLDLVTSPDGDEQSSAQLLPELLNQQINKLQ
jgi:hypothetical protein